MKLIILLLMLICFETKCQTLREFYMPDIVNITTIELTKILKNGEKSPSTRELSYISVNDSIFHIVFRPKWKAQLTAETMETIIIRENEIFKIRIRSNTILEKDKIRYFDPPILIFKMPELNQKTVWFVKQDNDETKIKYTAFWSTVRINDENRNAIKVIEEYPGFAKKASYYLKGYGLFKTELIDKFEKVASNEILTDKRIE